MKILGLQKQSLIEYPGRISAVIFLAGCNLKCQFCYVPHLVLPKEIKKMKEIPERKVISFLKERKGFLEAVALSGGEPTLNKELPEFIRKINSLGYLVEIETNGTNFPMLKELVEKKLVDYVAMDIKHDLIFEKYNLICGGTLTKQEFEAIKKSIDFLLGEKINYEFRTTLLKEFHQKKDILSICKKLKKAKVYFLQNYQEKSTISGKVFTPFEEKEILEIIKEGRKFTNIKYRKYL